MRIPIFQPSENHWRLRDYSERVTQRQLQYVLLNLPNPIFQGTPMKWAFKHVGVGIYDLFKKEHP